MRTGALVIGIIGGLLALGVGFAGYLFGALVSVSSAADGQMVKIMSFAAPIIALVGAGIVKSNPMPGALCMLACAGAFVFIIGFNFLTALPIVLLCIAGGLALMDIANAGPASNAPKQPAVSD